MKLIIQICCYNEAETLTTTLDALPQKVKGFDVVEWLIIDDGSTDDTARVARQNGVDHIVQLTSNQGLARAFMTGLETCLQFGADVIVHTDADNQYNADDIPVLTAPILNQRADIVIGSRPTETTKYFSRTKKFLRKFGSQVVRIVSQAKIPDTTSGFRAISREAAKRLMVFNDYTYSLETIIQAGQKNIAIVSVPIRTNEDLRPSRLMKNTWTYIKWQMLTILRIFVVYQPFKFFGTIGFILFGSGFLIGLRFLWIYFNDEGEGNVQSLILAGVLLGMGFQTLLIAFVTDLLAANRKLLEDIRCKTLEVSRNDEIK